jgi:hypothetical protein
VLEDGRTQSEVTLNFLLIRLCIAPDRWLLIRMITLTRDAWSNGRASATQRFISRTEKLHAGDCGAFRCAAG